MRKMREETLSVKSLEEYLFGVIRPIIRDPKLLRTGRQFKNIKLRPREILGAFLVCVVARYISNQEWTLARDTEQGDGIIYRKGSDEGYFLEQVYVYPRAQTALGTKQISNEIKLQLHKKFKKGKEYAKNRNLVIFLDVNGKIDHQDFKKYLEKVSDYFDSYWLFARNSEDIENFKYIVFLLKAPKDEQAAYQVTLNADFRGWAVNRLGRI